MVGFFSAFEWADCEQKHLKTVYVSQNDHNTLLEAHFGRFVLHQDSGEVHLIESGIRMTHVKGGVTPPYIHTIRCSGNHVCGREGVCDVCACSVSICVCWLVEWVGRVVLSVFVCVSGWRVLL